MSQIVENPSLSSSPYCRWQNVLARVLVAITILTMLLGGITKSKEAGLTIAEPVSFRLSLEWLMTDNIFAEYSHRVCVSLMAGVLLLLSIGIFITDRRPLARKLAIAALGVVLIQSVLGALTVQYLTKSHVSIPHAVMGQIFFGLACALACMTSRSWTSSLEPVQENFKVPLSNLGKWLIIALVIQLLLGAAIRHDDKGIQLRDGRQNIFLWHLGVHVLGSFYVIYRGMILMVRVFREHRTQKPIIVPTRWLMYLLGLQFLLGVVASVLKIMTGPSYELSNEPPISRVIFATAHQIVSALMLGFAVCVTMYAVRLLKPHVLEQKK